MPAISYTTGLVAIAAVANCSGVEKKPQIKTLWGGKVSRIQKFRRQLVSPCWNWFGGNVDATEREAKERLEVSPCSPDLRART